MANAINFDNIPPYSQDSEESVCGSLLIDGDVMNEVYSWLSHEDFWYEPTRQVFQVAKELYDRGEAIDQITVSTCLHDKNALDIVGGLAYLSHLVATVPTSLHVAEYGHSVKHYSFRRKAIQFGDKMKIMGFNMSDVNNIMQTASSEFINLQNSLNKPLLLTPDDLMKTAINHFADINNAERKPSLSFGFNNLDSITGGIFPGELWVLGARAKHGKTTLGWQIANSSCNKHTKRNCLFISLEMRSTELLEREAASLTGWKMSKVRSKKTDDEYDYLLFKISEQAESHIYYFGVSDSSGLSVKDMKSMATYMQKAYGLDMIVVDHLHLISDSDSKTEYERVTNVSRSLKMLALSLDVPILCLAQLNREVERRDVKNKRPVLSDIRGSGAVEQDASGILFFYRYNMYAGQEIVTGYDNLNQTDRTELIDRDDPRSELWLAGQRQGDVHNARFDLLWDRNTRIYGES